MTGAEFINWATNLITVLLGSSVVVTVLQKAFNRKTEREAQERQKQKDRDDKSKRDRDTEELLAQSRATAQQTALDSANQAYQSVAKRCEDCLDELHGLRDITGRLVDVVEALMQENTEETRAQARATIRLARRAM